MLMRNGEVKTKAVSDFPGGPVIKNLPASAGDTGSIPALGRFRMPRGAKPVHHKGWSLSTLEAMLHSKRSLRSKKPKHLN